MKHHIAKVALACLGTVVPALAHGQSSANNNQAFIDQQASTISSQSAATNEAVLLQSGSSNRLGTMNSAVTQDATGAAGNVFSAEQNGNANLVGFSPNGATTMSLLQTGATNTGTLVQTGNANVIGGLRQENLFAGGEGSTLTILQTGRGNYVDEVLQRNNGRGLNTAAINQTGDLNGYRTGTTFGDGSTAALNGSIVAGNREYIGVADAQLQFFFTSNGASAYYGPDDRPGSALYQYGGANNATISVGGSDNNFLVQQNSSTTQNGGGNRFAWTVTGSNNYAYALQVGTNLASNLTVGSQNAFLVYQAGEGGAASNGFGNVVAWQQGEKTGDIQNYAEIVQVGANNTVNGAQLGSVNVLRSYQQGVDNRLSAIAAGSSNIVDATQTGVSNSITVTQGGAARVVQH